MNTQNGSNNPLLRTLARGNSSSAGSPANSWKGKSTNSSSSPLLETLRQKSNAGETTARQRLQTGHTAPKTLGEFAFSGDYDADTEELQNRRNNATLWTKYLSALEADIEAGEKLYRSTKSEDDYKRYETTVDQYNRAVEEARPVYAQYEKDYKTYQDKHKGQLLLRSGRDYSDYTKDELDLAIETKQKEYDAFREKWGESVLSSLNDIRSNQKNLTSAGADQSDVDAVEAQKKQLASQMGIDRETLDRISYDAVQLEQQLNQLKYQQEVMRGYEVVKDISKEGQDALRKAARITNRQALEFDDALRDIRRLTGMSNDEIIDLIDEASYYLNSENAKLNRAEAEAAAEKNPGWETVKSVGRQTTSGMAGTADFLMQKAKNPDKVLDINAPHQMPGKTNTAVREKVAGDIASGDTTMFLGFVPNPTNAEDRPEGPRGLVSYEGVEMPDWLGGQNVGSFIYQAGTSALDSAVNAAIARGTSMAFGAAGSAAQRFAQAAVTDIMMGSNVARDTTTNLIKQGVSDDKALVSGLVSGAIEGFTEAVGVDNVFKAWSTSPNVWKNIAASALAEGGEEWMSNVLNRVSERIYNGNISHFKTLYYQNIDAGLSEEEALREATISIIGEDTSAILSGALSSVPMSGVAAASTREERAKMKAEAAKAKVSPVEAKYNEVSAANPDKTVMHPVATELTEAGYTDAAKAIKQGTIIEKILGGEDITDTELDALDLNNEAVRTVFANRTGMGEMVAVADFTRQLKREYANKAAQNARDLKATEEAAAASAQQTLEQEKAKAAELGKTLSRKENAAARVQQAEQGKAEAAARAAREEPVKTEGRTEEQVVTEVESRSGSTGIQSLSAFAENWQQEHNVESFDPQTITQMVTAYREYLGTLNLSRAESDALVSAGTRSMMDREAQARAVFDEEADEKMREEIAAVNAVRERGIDLPAPIEFLEELFLTENLKDKPESIEEIKAMYAAQARSMGVTEEELSRILSAFEYEVHQLFRPVLTNEEESGNDENTTTTKEDTNEREERSGNGRGAGERRGGAHDSGGAGTVSEGSGQHEMHDDGGRNGSQSNGREPGASGRVREAEDRKLISAQELFGSEKLGTDEANLHILTDEEIADNPEWSEIKKSVEAHGGKVVLLRGGVIHAIANGKSFDVRGVVNHATGEVYIIVDSKNATASQIKDHELFHFLAGKDPVIYDLVMRACEDGGLTSVLVKCLRTYQTKYPYGGAVHKYFEEIFGDANANMNPYNLTEMAEITRVVKEAMASEEVQERIRAIKATETQSEPDMQFSADPWDPFAGYDDIDEDMIQGYNPYEDMSEEETIESKLEEKFVHRYPSDYGEYEPASKKRRLSSFERDVGQANLDEFLIGVSNRRSLILDSAEGKDLINTYLGLPDEVRAEAERITYGRSDHTRPADQQTGASGGGVRAGGAGARDGRTVSGQPREDELRGVLRNAEAADAEREDRHFYSVTGREVKFPKGVRTDNLIPLSLDDVKRDPVLLGQWAKNAAYGAETFFVTSNGEGIHTIGGSGEYLDAAGFCTDSGDIVVCIDLAELNPKFISSHERFHWLCSLTRDITEESSLITEFFKKYDSYVMAADLYSAVEAYEQGRKDVESPYSTFEEMFSDLYAGGGSLLYQYAGLGDAFVGAVRKYLAKQFKGAAVRKRVKQLGLPDFSFSAAPDTNSNNYLELSDENLRANAEEYSTRPHAYFGLDFGLRPDTFDQMTNRQKVTVYLSMFGAELEHMVSWDMVPTKAVRSIKQYEGRMMKGELTPEQVARKIYEDTHEAEVDAQKRRSEQIRKAKENARIEEAEPELIEGAIPELSKELSARDKAMLPKGPAVAELRKHLSATDHKAENIWKEFIKKGTGTKSFFNAPGGQQIISYLKALGVQLGVEIDGEIRRSRAIELAIEMQGAVNRKIITARAAAEAIQQQMQNPTDTDIKTAATVAIKHAKGEDTAAVEAKDEAEDNPKVSVQVPQKTKEIKFTPPKPKAAPVIKAEAKTEAPNFVNDVFNTKPGKGIIVTFKGGKTAEYTTNILSDLKTDPDVASIVDKETGGVIYEAASKPEVKPEPIKVLPAEKTEMPVQEAPATETQVEEATKTEEKPKPAKIKPAPKKTENKTPAKKKGGSRKKRPPLPEKVETEQEQEQFKEAYDETHGSGAAEQILDALNTAAAKVEALERALEAEKARVAELEQKEKGAEARKEARKTISLETHKQEMKRLNKLLNANARTDQAWARGLAASADRFARAEERRIAERKLRDQRIKARTEKRDAVKAEREKANAALEAQRKETSKIVQKLEAAAKSGAEFARGLIRSREANLKADARSAVSQAKKQTKHENTVDAKKAKQTLAHRRHTGPADPTNNGSGTVLNAHDVMAERKKVVTAAEKLRTAGRAFYRAFVAATAELESFARKQLRTLRVDVLANVMGAYMDTVQTISEGNLLGRDGRILGNSMQDTFLCWKGEGKNREWDKDAQQTLKEYMVYMHTVELMSFEQRAWDALLAFEEQYPFFVDMTSAEFASLVSDGNELALEYVRLMKQAETAENKAVLADEDGKDVSAETAKAAAEKLAELQPWVVDKANEIYQWWDTFMREWAVGTQLSLEQYENMRAMYPHYVPLHRVLDGAGPGGSAFARDGYIGTGKITHAIEGSTLPIQELEDQFYGAMQRIVRLNRANELYRSVIEEAMFDTDGTFAEYAVFDWASAEPALKQDLWDYDSDVDTSSLSETKDHQYKVSAYIDGVKVSAYINKGMYEGLEAVTGARSDRLSKVITFGAKITGPMKTMLTGINPTFAVRNVVRDFPTAVTNSISGVAFPKYYAEAAAQIAKNSEHWQRFKALGGAHANYYNMEKGYGEALAQKPGAVGKAVDFMGTINNVTEAQTRFAEYLATIDRMPGGDTYENRLLGIKNSAEVTVDFSRAGVYGRLINAWVPYWNPAIQGVDKVFRSVFQQPSIAKKAKTIGRAALCTILPEILAYALRKALGREEEWEELSDYVRDSYYCIPLKDEHEFLRIPKNREWGAILGTSFMRILEGIEGRENPFENYFETSINTNFLPPEILSNAIGVSWALELKGNENFAGSQIVPYAYQDVPKTEQYDADTSQLAYLAMKAGKFLGAELSPMQVDYILQDYVGDFYGLFISSFSHGLFTGEVTGEDILADVKSELRGSWVSDNRYSNLTVTNYYAMVDQLDSEVNTLKLRDPNYDESTAYKLRTALNTSDGFAKRISNLNKEARMLPDGAEKNAIKEEIVALAGEALTFYDRVMSGEISDPTLYAKYAAYGEDTALELIRLSSFNKEYAFEPSAPGSEKITDPDSRLREFVLTKNQKDAYAAFYDSEYAKLAAQTRLSFAYQNASDVEKVELLEEMNSRARENATTELVEWMRSNGVTPEVKAAYQKYSKDVLDTLVYLDSYQSSEAYNFMPRDDAPSEYVDPRNSKYKYYLNDYYKTQYKELYRIIYEDLFWKATSDPRFKTYTPAQQASRLHDMKEDVGELAKENIIELMRRDGFLPEIRDTRAEY